MLYLCCLSHNISQIQLVYLQWRVFTTRHAQPLCRVLFCFSFWTSSCFIILCLTMSPKKSAVVPALFAFGPPVPSLCLSLYYPKASKLAFAHPRDHKSRGGATQSPARSYVVVVAVTSILATCRALGIFYKNNLTRFLQEQQQQQCNNNAWQNPHSPDFRANAAHIVVIIASFLCLYSPLPLPLPLPLSPAPLLTLSPAVESLECCQYEVAFIVIVAF